MADNQPINGSMFPVQMEKPHDCSFDKDKSLMRHRLTKGWGEDVRDGSTVTVHFTVHTPGDEKEELVYDSAKKYPSGLKFVVGQNLYAEVLDRGVLGITPGSVVNVICSDELAATDKLLGIEAPELCEKAVERVIEVQMREFANHEPSIIKEKNDEFAQEARAWRPPKSITRWNIRLDSATEGVVPVYLRWPEERLDWSISQKNWGGELVKAGQFQRAGRRYKKALLDLEIPTDWEQEKHIISRNHLRLTLHLNIALCAVKSSLWDEALWHSSRALKIDPKNVKALFRRACANFKKPEHPNGLHDALDDLRAATELDPQNKEVASLLAEARRRQKLIDKGQAGMYSKMLEAADFSS